MTDAHDRPPDVDALRAAAAAAVGVWHLRGGGCPACEVAGYVPALLEALAEALARADAAEAQLRGVENVSPPAAQTVRDLEAERDMWRDRATAVALARLNLPDVEHHLARQLAETQAAIAELRARLELAQRDASREGRSR